jgi:hypothetical protein
MDCDLFGFVMNFVMWIVDKFAENMYHMTCLKVLSRRGSQKHASYLKTLIKFVGDTWPISSSVRQAYMPMGVHMASRFVD